MTRTTPPPASTSAPASEGTANASVCFGDARVNIYRVWTVQDVKLALELTLAGWGLPLVAKNDLIFIKLDLETNMPALWGSTTDLRVLAGLFEVLRDAGCTNLVAGSRRSSLFTSEHNVPHRQLRVDRLCQRTGVRWVDLDASPAVTVGLPSGLVSVPRVTLDAALLINVPKLKTHRRDGLAIGASNLLHLLSTGDVERLAGRRHEVMLDMVRHFVPSVTLVDGLVAMEGNGPYQGNPVKLGLLAAGSAIPFVDLVSARAVGFTAEEIPYLWRALREGKLHPEMQIQTETAVAIWKDIRRTGEHSAARRTSEMMASWAKKWLENYRPNSRMASVFNGESKAYSVGSFEHNFHHLERRSEFCGTCRRCESVCPVGLKREEIGALPTDVRCLECMYCLVACDRGALQPRGSGENFLEQVAARRSLFDNF